MLAHLLGAKYIEQLHRPELLPTTQKDILALIGGNLPHKSDFTNVVKTHERYTFHGTPFSAELRQYDKIVCIVRDPRDVAVSHYHFTYDHLPIAFGNAGAVLSGRRNWFIRKCYWKKILYKVAKDWPLHTLSWLSYEGARTFKYEDLHADCEGTLRKIVDYLEVDVSTDLLKQSVALFSFEKLSGGREKGEEKSYSFFRKGIVGDHKHRLSNLDRLLFRYYAGNEMRELGYV
jgi:hypothetical protein